MQPSLHLTKSSSLSSRSIAPSTHTHRAPRINRSIRSNDNGATAITAELNEGDKVKVKSPVTVYHVGKFKQGIDMAGLEGTIVGNASQFQGLELSANLPWKVQFFKDAPDGGKPVKFICHFEEDEIETV